MIADWANLTGIPADIADGDADTQYTAGAGLALSAGNEFSLNATGSITSSTLTITGGANVLSGNVSIEIPAGAISGGATGVIASNSITQGDIANNAVGPGEIQSDAVSSNADYGAQDVITTNGFFVGAQQLTVPDYVFQKYFDNFSELKNDYEFMPLTDLEVFLKQNKHLPGIKSAAQVKRDGYWNLSESNIKNLEKIEELFLHTIEQEKKITTLQNENETLNKELEALKADMELIKAMLQTKSDK